MLITNIGYLKSSVLIASALKPLLNLIYKKEQDTILLLWAEQEALSIN
jgi:hypothetical protein